MYVVRRNNRVLFKGQVFKSYEKARQALRKYIREMVAKGKASYNDFGWWDDVSRNPTRFSHLGFNIRQLG